MLATGIAELNFLAAGDGEGGNGYFLIAVLIISAIHWVSQRLKERRDAQRAERSAPDLDDPDWQFGREEEPESPAPPRPASDELRRFFESLTGTPEPVAPPPLPVHRPRRARPSAPPPPAPTVAPSRSSGLTRAEELALAAIEAGESHLTLGRTHRQRLHSSREHSTLAKMLRDPVGMRNAFILKEILDPPVASRVDPMPHSP